ncbi:hypothetical protein [Croceiramulus getboli]|nr:hypothetical protein P8624_08455 [Flavobacteriaceae bacterium YJPT1-3]
MKTTSPKTKTLGLVITDGVGYRNFVLSRFPEQVPHSFDKIVVFSGLPASVYKGLNPTHFQIVELPVYRERKHNWFLRKLKEIAHLKKHRKHAGIRDGLRFNYRSGWRPNDVLVKTVYAITSLFHSEAAILFYESLQNRAFSRQQTVKTYGRLLDQHPVDLLFFTHQRPPFIAAVAAQAKQRKIKTASFIFSWDNLSSKGRMATTFDQYLVWSDLMKEELLEFYPRTSPEAVFVVGTPQFEPYVMERYTLSRNRAGEIHSQRESGALKEFLERFSLDGNNKIICYSCADASIGGNDVHVISKLMEGVRRGHLGAVEVLVRTSPAEGEERFAKLKQEFPELKWNHPYWELSREGHPEPWSQRIPTEEDLTNLRAVLTYSDINVNMLSTMSLDFMIFEKPVVNTAFGNEENGLYNDQRFLEYAHYKRVLEYQAVRLAKNEQELITHLKTYLKDPKTDHEQREALLKRQLGQPLEQISKKIVESLAQIVKRT